MTGQRRRLGQVLLETGVINADQLQLALAEQRRSGVRLGAALIQLGLITEALVRDALAETLGRRGIDLRKLVVDQLALQKIPVRMARRYRLLPVAWDAQRCCLRVAMTDTRDIGALDQLRRLLDPGDQLEPVLAAAGELDQAIERCYGSTHTVSAVIAELERDDGQAVTRQPTQPVVRLVEALIREAVAARASDIHLEPEQGFVRIRYRIDGLLQPVRSLHGDYWPGIVARLKVLAGMNIAESRAPQDGHFSLTLAGRQVDFRVAALPVTWGENLVLRILDREKVITPLAELLSDRRQTRMIQGLLERPDGMILITGPTGSGKTTTLYSLVREISNEHCNVMTLEDPVEYPMPLVRQAEVNASMRMDFADGIRAMLRQDPDAMLVGEIRDPETAAMSFRAALTGHRVLTTLHSGTVLGVPARLRELGVSSDLLCGNINGIIAQRLIRRLCRQCRVPVSIAGLMKRCPWLSDGQGLPEVVYQADGCEHCAGLGYRGRLAIMEILPVDEALDQLLMSGAGRAELTAQAVGSGLLTLSGDVVLRVLAGQTSIDEAARVVDLRRDPGAWRADLSL